MKRITYFMIFMMFLVVLFVNFVSADIISATQANGTIAYNQLNQREVKYRIWNSTDNSFTDEDNDTIGIEQDPRWVILKANHERDEFILGTTDDGSDINIQILNATKNWVNRTELSVVNTGLNLKKIDIAVEDISGNVMIVYDNSSSVDNEIYYIVWNGTEYSSPVTTNTGISTPASFISLHPKKGSNDIMLLMQNGSNDVNAGLWAILWNGTAFESRTNTTLDEMPRDIGAANVEWDFDFAWESNSGDGLAVYGNSSNGVFTKNFTASTKTWSATGDNLLMGENLNSVSMCSDPSSDYIGIIASDLTTDVHAFMWNGTDHLGNPPTDDPTTRDPGSENINLACTWINSTDAMFGFIDTTLAASNDIDYFNFSKPNTWSTSDLAVTESTFAFATNQIKGMYFYPHPVINNEFLIIVEDLHEDVHALHWNGTSFVNVTVGNPIETVTEVTDGNQRGAMFAWSEYDPNPSVTGITFNASSVGKGQFINVTATVTDNVAVDSVLINITHANGTEEQFIATGVGNIYNLTFTNTNDLGTFTAEVIANDSSTHMNINATESDTFDVVNNAPTMTVPAFNVSTITKASGVKISSTYNDADGDSGSIYFEVYVNGSSKLTANLTSISPGQNTFTALSNNLYARGDIVNATVYANDGTDNSVVQETVDKIVANTPPTVDDPFSNISVLTETSGIQINTTHRDTDNDKSTIYFEWFKNDNSVFTQNLTNIVTGQRVNTILSSSFYAKGDQINLTVYAYDNNDNSTIRNSSTFTVANTAPFMTSPAFNVSTITKTSGVKVTADYSDADSDAGTVYYEWYSDGSSIFTDNQTSITSGSTVTSTLSTALYSKGEQINVTVYANDGTDDSAIAESTDKIVANTAPTIETPVFNVTNLTKNSGLKANTTYNDIDGDTSTVYFEWFANGSSIFTQNLTSISAGTIVNSTLATNLYNADDLLNVTVFANDGTDNSATQKSTLITVQNITGTTSIDIANSSYLYYSPSSITKDDTVRFNATFNVTGNTNATNTNVSLFVDGTYITETSVNITNGSSLIVNLSWTAQNGTHTAIMFADANNTYSETNESNNNATATFSVANPSEGGNSEKSGGAAPSPSPSGEAGLEGGISYNNLKSGDYFIPPGKSSNQKVTVISIYPNSVRLSIGNNINVIILKGLLKSFDTNGNGVADMTIYVDEVISYSRADLTVSIEEDTEEVATNFFDIGAVWEKVFGEQQVEESPEEKEIAELKAELAKLKAEIQEKEQKIADLESELQSLLKQYTDQEDSERKEIIEKEISNLQSELDSLKIQQIELEDYTKEPVADTEIEQNNDAVETEPVKEEKPIMEKAKQSVLSFFDLIKQKTAITGSVVADTSTNFIATEIVHDQTMKGIALFVVLILVIIPLTLGSYAFHRKKRRRFDELDKELENEFKVSGLGKSN